MMARSGPSVICERRGHVRTRPYSDLRERPHSGRFQKPASDLALNGFLDSPHNPQLDCRGLRGIGADHDLYGSGLNRALHLAVDDGKLSGAEVKDHGPRLPRLQLHPLESCEALHRLNDTAVLRADVKLDHFAAGTSAAVGNANGNTGGFTPPDAGPGKPR